MTRRDNVLAVPICPLKALAIALLTAQPAAAAPGVEPLWRGELGSRDIVELLEVDGTMAWLLNHRYGGDSELIELDLTLGTAKVTPVDMGRVNRAVHQRPGTTDADRGALALLLDHGWALDYVGSSSLVASVDGGFIATGGAPVGTRGDWLWRFDTSGAAVERFTDADAGYYPMVSPDGDRLMFHGCKLRTNGFGCDYTMWYVDLQRAAVVKAEGPFSTWRGAAWSDVDVALVTHLDDQGNTCIARFTLPLATYRDLVCKPGLEQVTWSPSRDVALFDDRGLLTRVSTLDGQVLGEPAHAEANAHCRLISGDVALCDSVLVDLVRDVSFAFDGVATPVSFGDIALLQRRKTGRAELVRVDPAAIRSAVPPATQAPDALRGALQVDGRSYPIDVRLDRPSPPVRSGRAVAWGGELFFQGGYVPAVLTLDLDTGVSEVHTSGPQWDPLWLPDGRLAGLGRDATGQVCLQIKKPSYAAEASHCVDADDASLVALDATHALFSWAPPVQAPGAPWASLRLDW